MRSPMEILAVAWPQPLSDTQIDLYVEALADVPLAELSLAMGWLVRTEEFRPTIATIRRTVVQARGGFPSDSEAWAQALLWDGWEDQRRFASASYHPKEPVVHEAVKAAYAAVGVGHQPSFRKAYTEQRTAFTAAAVVGRLDAPALGPGL